MSETKRIDHADGSYTLRTEYARGGYVRTDETHVERLPNGKTLRGTSHYLRAAPQPPEPSQDAPPNAPQ